MGKQSTRHRYKSRGDKNRETTRVVRIVGWGLLVFFIILLVMNGQEWWRYYRTYFY